MTVPFTGHVKTRAAGCWEGAAGGWEGGVDRAAAGSSDTTGGLEGVGCAWLGRAEGAAEAGGAEGRPMFHVKHAGRP